MRLNGIQVLRGVAALAVALFHFHVIELVNGPDQLTPALFEYGRIGVDLFFVISGAIMMHVAGRNPPAAATARTFLARRAVRIYPPYWVVTAGLVAVWLLSGKAFFDGIIGPDPNLATSFALWPGVREPALGVGWTLIHEMYFYLVFTLLLLAPVRLRLPLMGVWAALIIGVWIAGNRNLAPPLAVATSPLTLEFILGAGAMSLAPRLPAGARKIAGALGLACLLLALAWHGNTPDPATFADPMRRVLAFGPGAALLVLAVSIPYARAGHWPAPAIALGDWSYALYLVHVPVYAVLGVVWSRFAGPGLFDNAAALAVFIAVALAVSAVFYRLVERPSQGLSRLVVSRVRRPARAES